MKNHRPADKLLFLNGDQAQPVLSYELIPAIGQALVIFLPVECLKRAPPISRSGLDGNNLFRHDV